MDDFVAYQNGKVDVLFANKEWFGYDDLKKFLPKANLLHKIDVMPTNSQRNRETMAKIESK